jgi:hypothetical protein
MIEGSFLLVTQVIDDRLEQARKVQQVGLRMRHISNCLLIDTSEAFGGSQAKSAGWKCTICS